MASPIPSLNFKTGDNKCCKNNPCCSKLSNVVFDEKNNKFYTTNKNSYTIACCTPKQSAHRKVEKTWAAIQKAFEKEFNIPFDELIKATGVRSKHRYPTKKVFEKMHQWARENGKKISRESLPPKPEEQLLSVQIGDQKISLSFDKMDAPHKHSPKLSNSQLQKQSPISIKVGNQGINLSFKKEHSSKHSSPHTFSNHALSKRSSPMLKSLKLTEQSLPNFFMQELRLDSQSRVFYDNQLDHFPEYHSPKLSENPVNPNISISLGPLGKRKIGVKFPPKNIIEDSEASLSSVRDKSDESYSSFEKENEKEEGEEEKKVSFELKPKDRDQESKMNEFFKEINKEDIKGTSMEDYVI